jgi:hypothetical protein
MNKAIALFRFALLFSGMIRAQEKTTMSIKYLNSGNEKHINKNYRGYKTLEARYYSLVYVMTIQKDDMSVKLIFDRDSNFLIKAAETDMAKVSYKPVLTSH